MLGLLPMKVTKVCFTASVWLMLHSSSLAKRVAVIVTGVPSLPAAAGSRARREGRAWHVDKGSLCRQRCHRPHWVFPPIM
jgi:hypothetical protein